MPANMFKVNEKEYILPGSRACQGCGLSLAYRYMLKALRENTIVTLPACCLCVGPGGGSPGPGPERHNGCGDGRGRGDLRHGNTGT